MTLSCARVREALSAELDHEPAAEASGEVANHLERCDECRTWRMRAEELTRAVRVRAVAVPDLTATVLAAVAADPVAVRGARMARGRRQTLRAALSLSAVAQFLLAVPMLLASPGQVGARSLWEMAALQAAVAAGYLVAAWRPRHARAMLPMALVLAAGLVVVGVRDVANDPSTLPHNMGHLVALVQAGLLWGLSRVGAPAARYSTSDADVRVVA